MTHSKNNAGFTLVEVLVTLTIVVSSLVPILATQTALIRSVGNWSRAFDRMLNAQHYEQEVTRTLTDEQEKTLEKKITDPPTILKYQLKKMSDNSTLKTFKDMCMQTVTMQWREGTRQREDELVTFIYKPQKKKE